MAPSPNKSGRSSESEARGSLKRGLVTLAFNSGVQAVSKPACVRI